MLSGNRVKAALLQCSIFLDLWSDLYLVLYLKACGCCLAGANMWEFPKIGVPYFGVLIIRVLLFRLLYSGPLFSETSMSVLLLRGRSRGDRVVLRESRLNMMQCMCTEELYPKQNPKLQRLYPSSPKPGTLNSLNPLDPPTTL